jgi:hypothetical protein
VSGPPYPHQGKFRKRVVMFPITVTMALLKGNMVVVSEGRAVSVQTYLFIDSLSRASDRGELDCKLAKQQICAGRR